MRLSKFCAVWLWLAACCLKAAESAQSVNLPDPTQATGSNDVCFRWGIGSFDTAQNRMTPIKTDATISSNAAVVMFVEPESSCYVYVLAETGEGEYEWHFPGNSPVDVETFHKQAPNFIPPPPMGLHFSSPKGQNNKIYVFASSERLKDLETRFTKYNKAAEQDKNLCASDLAALIDKYEKGRPKPTSDDNPVALAMRSGDQNSPSGKSDIDSLAREIRAKKFFAETIILRSR